MSPEAQRVIDEITLKIKKLARQNYFDHGLPTVGDFSINGWSLKCEFNKDPELIKNNIIDCTIIATPPLNHITLNFVIDKNGVVKFENNEQPTK